MHEEQNGQQGTFSSHDAISPELNALFEQLNPQDVEQFYRKYQLWTTQRHIAQLNAQIAEFQQERNQNAECMQRVQPPPIALSVLAQLQAHGIEDIDLLDRMLERGEEWLDHTMELLTRCEALDMIQGDYTRWCEHALEGAYDWIDSMTEAQAWPEEVVTTDATTIEQTEALLLYKLMSDEDAQPELAGVIATPPSEREAVHEHTFTTSDEFSVPDEEEMQPEMGATIEFALDEPPVANEEPAVDEQPVTNEEPATETVEMTTVRGKITGPLQPKVTGPLQSEDDDTTRQEQEEAEVVVGGEVEAITTSEDDDATIQAQDEAEITTVTEEAAPLLEEDEAPVQAQDETIIEEHISEEVNAEQPPETREIVHDEPEAEPPDHIAEDQPQEEATQSPDEHTAPELQHEEEQTRVNEDDHALPPIDEQRPSTPVNSQSPSSELLNGQSQHSEPANGLQQPEAINNHQESSPEAIQTTATAAPYNKAPQAKKRRRGWFSWLFGRKS